MANVSYWQASWVSMEGYPMSPGDVHYWEASPLGYLEAWSVTAVPIAGGEDPTVAEIEGTKIKAGASVEELRKIGKAQKVITPNRVKLTKKS